MRNQAIPVRTGEAAAPVAAAGPRNDAHTSPVLPVSVAFPAPALAARHARRLRLEPAGPGLYRVRGRGGSLLAHVRVDDGRGAFHLERRTPPAPGGRVRVQPLGVFWRLDDALDAVGA